jgi:DNA-binding MarR family transcriptional regulator
MPQGIGAQLRQWLVLDATRLLMRRTGDAVSQSQVAVHLELDRQALSDAMPLLERMGLVSRGAGMSGPAWRVYVTDEGLSLLRQYRQSIELVSLGC